MARSLYVLSLGFLINEMVRNEGDISSFQPVPYQELSGPTLESKGREVQLNLESFLERDHKTNASDGTHRFGSHWR